MPVDPKQVQALFLAAIECAERTERATVLEYQCGDDTELRGRVEALLEAHDNPAELPRVPLASMGATIGLSPAYCSGTLIGGRYMLLDEIAEGGMGTVWVAQQTEPVRRRVALKLIKPGMDSQRVLSRFEVERQSLAMMDHPNIAKVLDGGVTEQGRPFFVMEYVDGVPINDYCDQARLTLTGRLKLFVQICQAVQHAHQKGIIHRDLKPANVLVCLYDGVAVPKVIDFGLAKAMHEQLMERSLDTAQGLMLGTPLYMSPEQAEFNNLDIDTRTDVYSLGVILYELLTGTTPLEKQRFKDAAWQEILRLIKEEEPPRPSTKLSDSDSLPTIAAQRSLEPAQLSRAVRGDLDWITMKSLEKERGRRYETANDLARDIERYLHDEPVQARPPSASYRFRKFASRNRMALTTAALVSTTLVFGTVVSTWQAVRATRAERAAESARSDEAQHRQIAEAQRNEAEKRHARAEADFRKARKAVDDYFTSVSESKLLNVPALQPLRNELLDSALAYYRQFIGQYGDDPAVQVELADAYVRVGNLTADATLSKEQALAALQKGVEGYERLTRDNPTVMTYRANLARAYNDLGVVQRVTGRMADAEVSYRRALVIREELARESPSVSDYSADLARAYVNLGIVQSATQRLAEAEASFRRAIEIYETRNREDPGVGDYRADLADAYYNLGPVQRMTGRLADAEASYGRALEIYETLARENRTDAQYWAGVAGASYNLGHVNRMTGRLAEAESSYRRALEIYEELAREYPTVALYRVGIARAYFHLGLLQSIAGRRAEANRSWILAVAAFAVAGELGYSAEQVFSGQGDALAMLGEWQDAADAFAKVVDVSDHAWKPQFKLALVQSAAGDEAGYRATCSDLVSRHGHDSDGTQAVAIAMACIVGQAAVDDMDKVLAISRRAAASDPGNPVQQTLVGAAQFRAAQTQQAIAALKKSLPLHALAELAAPMQRDSIRASCLVGETVLALAYREHGDQEALATQLQKIRSLIEQMESAPPQYSDGAERWLLPLSIHIAKRELARQEAQAAVPGDPR